MKKSLALICSLALCLGLFAGCSSSNADGSASPSASVPASPSQEASQAPAALSGVVNTDGSTSMEKVVKVLSESFMQDNGGVTINYNGSGSGTGIQSVIDGTCDLGLSSRELKDEEAANGAVAHVVALDGVAIVVNPANTVADLTVEQIAKIYTGEIADWSELGGAAPSRSSVVRPAPAPAAPLRRSWAWQMPASTPTSTPPPVMSSATWPPTPTPSGTPPCPL